MAPSSTKTKNQLVDWAVVGVFKFIIALERFAFDSAEGINAQIRKQQRHNFLATSVCDPLKIICPALSQGSNAIAKCMAQRT